MAFNSNKSCINIRSLFDPVNRYCAPLSVAESCCPRLSSSCRASSTHREPKGRRATKRIRVSCCCCFRFLHFSSRSTVGARSIVVEKFLHRNAQIRLAKTVHCSIHATRSKDKAKGRKSHRSLLFFFVCYPQIDIRSARRQHRAFCRVRRYAAV